MSEATCVHVEETYIKCAGEVTFEPDPFAEDVWGDDTPVWMCARHRYESAMDI